MTATETVAEGAPKTATATTTATIAQAKRTGKSPVVYLHDKALAGTAGRNVVKTDKGARNSKGPLVIATTVSGAGEIAAIARRALKKGRLAGVLVRTDKEPSWNAKAILKLWRKLGKRAHFYADPDLAARAVTCWMRPGWQDRIVDMAVTGDKITMLRGDFGRERAAVDEIGELATLSAKERRMGEGTLDGQQIVWKGDIALSASQIRAAKRGGDETIRELDGRELIKPGKAAKLLGVSKKHIRALVGARIVKGREDGKRMRVDKKDLAQYGEIRKKRQQILDKLHEETAKLGLYDRPRKEAAGEAAARGPTGVTSST